MQTQQQTPQALPEICTARDQVVAQLDRCAERRYVYVQAPAGYGKTVSALLWLKRRQLPFAWLTLDSYDNAPSLFYRLLCHALMACLPEDEALVQLLNSPQFSSSPVERAMELLMMLPWRDEAMVLVLDDFQSIVNEEVLRSLPHVLKRLPASVSVLFLSRTQLPEAMSALSAGDQTAFLGSADLAFTADEIRALFAAHGHHISRQEADEVFCQTEGWVIILNAMLIGDEIELVLERQDLSLEQFFERNIWSGLDDSTRGFLLKTAVVESFTLGLCELLTEEPDCAARLAALMQGNISLSMVGGEYRYHNLFLGFLRGHLESSGIDLQRLYQVAAHYHLEAKNFFEAAGYARKAGDASIDMQIIQGFFESETPNLDQYYELAQVYDIRQLPEQYSAERPILYMPNILSAILTGDIESAPRYFDLFYRALPTFVKLNHPIADVAVTRLILDYRQPLAKLPAFIESLGLKFNKPVAGQSAVVTMQMPLLHRSNRDYSEFLNASARRNMRGLLGCLLPDDVEAFYASVTACLLMEQDRLPEALQSALEAYGMMSEKTTAEVRFGVSLGLAQIYALMQDRRQCRAVIDELAGWIEGAKAHYLLKNLTAFEQRLRLWDGEQKAATEWLENYYVGLVDQGSAQPDGQGAFGEFYKIYQHFTTARALIALSMPEQALAALAQLKALGDGMGRPLDSAEAEVLSTIVEWALGEREQAAGRMVGLLAALEPYGYVRVVANEGKSVLPVLAAAVKLLEKQPGGEALYRFAKEVQAAAHEQSKGFKGLTYDVQLKPVKLSPRQATVLELLAKGYRNAEIVQITGLSLNTIRTHTKAIYQKLEVNSALDAIAKARRLGLLE